MAQFKAIPTFRDDEGNVIQFFAVRNVVGFTHRVAINGVANGWLGDHCKPSAKVAAFFFKKYQSQESSVTERKTKVHA